MKYSPPDQYPSTPEAGPVVCTLDVYCMYIVWRIVADMVDLWLIALMLFYQRNVSFWNRCINCTVLVR